MTSTPDRPVRPRRRCGWPALLAGLCVVAWPASGQNEAQLQALRQRIESLQVELNETRGERDEVRAQLRDTERRLGRSFKAMRDTEAQLRADTRRLESLQQARTRQRAELAAHRQELEQTARAAYLLGRQDYIKLLLNQDDPSRVSRVLTYYRYLSAARAARIARIEAALGRLDAVEKQIAERVQGLAELRARHLEQKTALEATHAERQVLLAQLNDRVRDRSQEIERLQHDEARMTRLVRELRTALARQPPAPRPPDAKIDNRRGHWRLPVQGRLVARFGGSREIGDLRWRGIFLATGEGQEVRAVTGGRVVYADWLRGFGLLVVLDHGGGLMSLYGHNRSLYKGVGDQVEAGEVIAASGNTGGPAQPGLYFEIRENGEPRDPLDWCKL